MSASSQNRSLACPSSPAFSRQREKGPIARVLRCSAGLRNRTEQFRIPLSRDGLEVPERAVQLMAFPSTLTLSNLPAYQVLHLPFPYSTGSFLPPQRFLLAQS